MRPLLWLSFLLALAGPASADCFPAPLPVVWVWIVPMPTIQPVPNPKAAPADVPRMEPVVEPSRKEPVKPPLMPVGKDSPEAKLPSKKADFVVFVVQGARKEEGYRVKFFNRAERDVTLEIDGKEVKLAAGESASVKPAREFVWGEKGGAANRHSIPPDALGLDIVLRR